MSEPDLNKIASAVTVEVAKEYLRTVLTTIPKNIGKRISYLFPNFEVYLNLTYERCSHVRTIINKDKSFHISEIYVPGSFRHDNQIISDQELIQIIRDCRPTVVVGFGGIGKTVFTKQLWCSIFREPHGKIPIFLELRRLNSLTNIDLLTYIRHSVSAPKNEIDEEAFLSFLHNGLFVFILDGFDELTEINKEKISQEILDIGNKYRGNGIVVSSRHLGVFQSWQRFDIVRALPFDKQQTEMLISKVPYDKKTKKIFKKEIVDKKYEQYREFLSTPLLTMMMLMTFSQFAEVPDKKSVFYRYAFLTLYSWHDSSKEVFNREKQSGLTLDEFEKFFSIFCFITYINRAIEFDSKTLNDNVNKTKSYISTNFDSQKVISEICESVNLMFKDGDIFVFTHRSFQEYFMAYAIVNFFQSKIPELLDRVSMYGDSVLSLMTEINNDVVDEYYVDKISIAYEEEIRAVSRNKDLREIAGVIGMHFILGFSAQAGDVGLRIYGMRQSASSWNVVKNIADLFDAEFSRDNLQKMEMVFDINSMQAENTAERIVNLFNLKKGKDFVIAYSVAQDSFSILECEDIMDDFDEAYTEVIKQEKWVKIDDHDWLENANKAMVSIKANYVFTSRQISNARKRIAKKDGGIDDVLKDFRN